MKSSLGEMMARHAVPGRIEAIYLRPERRADVASVEAADLKVAGLAGDHALEGKRALTLFQAEHLPVIAALAGRSDIDAGLLRRNIVVSGLNLLGFRKALLVIGEAEIEVTGPCPPCSRMEEVLGHGGYTAMRGHGGVYAAVVRTGMVTVGDSVLPSADD